MLVLRLKWELVLLLLVLLLCMLPTAGLFRWSFRWLPFFHLVLAICAAEVLQVWRETRRAEWSLRWPGSAIAATTAIALVVLTAIAMSVLHTGGAYAFPLAWIFLGLVTLWCLLEFILRDSAFREWTPASDHLFGACLRHIFAFRQTAAFRNTIFLKSCLNLRRSIRIAFISASIHGRSWSIAWKQTTAGRPSSATRKHVDVGRIAIHQRLQPDPRGRCGARIRTPPFTVRLTLTWENHLLNDQAGPDGELALLAWTESLLREKWISRLSPRLNGSWLFQQTKEASSIGEARHLPVCARSLQLIRGLMSNLFPRRFHGLMIREIAWKQILMCQPAIGLPC